MISVHISYTSFALLFSTSFDMMSLPNEMETPMDELTQADIDYVSTVAGYQVTEDEAREFLHDYNDYYEEYLAGPLAASLL